MGQRGCGCVQKPEPTREAGPSQQALSAGPGGLQDWNLLLAPCPVLTGHPRGIHKGAQSPPRGVSLAWPRFSPNHLLDGNYSTKLRPGPHGPLQACPGVGGGDETEGAALSGTGAVEAPGCPGRVATPVLYALAGLGPLLHSAGGEVPKGNGRPGSEAS